MKRIVVGYDDSEPSQRALARAAELATTYDAEVLVTSVARIVAGAAVARGIGPYYAVDTADVHQEELRHAAEILERAGVRHECIVTVGDPATEIIALAQERGADLIVVGTREAGFLERLLDPSVSNAVQRRAHRDVLIVH